jgi:broad specificity phosphatase PhoE
LNAEGRRHAERLTEAFRGAGVAAVISSPLERAVQTAAAISRGCGAPIERDDRIIEVDSGSGP